MVSAPMAGDIRTMTKKGRVMTYHRRTGMYCRVVLLYLWRRTWLVNDTAGKGARAGSQLTHY